MADQNPNRITPEKLEYGETHPPRNDIKEQRGGSQDNQITGQTEEGAHNQDMKGLNPQGNNPVKWSR
jgi:hypothetical protein